MSYLHDELKGKMVLVIGATGFIGGRLAQRLAVEEGAIVTGTGRDLNKAPFLKEAGVTLKTASLQDEAAWPDIIAGQEIIFHVAAWMGGGRLAEDEEMATALNVTAVENLVRLAGEAGGKRFVLVSSITVYGLPGDVTLDETCPLDTTQTDLYGRTKALGDTQARQLAAELGLELAVVRPGMVYGPRSKSWTIGMVKLVQEGTPVIFGDGSGHTFPTYIDNLVDALLLTAVHPEAAGEAFNICDATITWRAYFEDISRMCAIKPRRMPMWVAWLLVWVNRLFKLGIPLNQSRLQYLSQKATFPRHKAEQKLGYHSRISLAEGQKATEAWLRAEGYLTS